MSRKNIEIERSDLMSILNNKKYTIHYYQREYKWGSSQVKTLIDDLYDVFSRLYEEGQKPSDFGEWDLYFMGSIITTNFGMTEAIVDGQQRLTTFTLLMIYMTRIQRKNNLNIEKTADLIRTLVAGEESLVIDVKEDPYRGEVIRFLLDDMSYSENPSVRDLVDEYVSQHLSLSVSARNMLERYVDIEAELNELFFADGNQNLDRFSCFIAYVCHDLRFALISTPNEDEAYRVFVTMNDRGLSLNQVDLLKGFLLSKIEKDSERNAANKKWQEAFQTIVRTRNDGSDSEEGSDRRETEFMQFFLRARYAETIRQAGKNTPDRDYEKLGSSFYSWVRNNTQTMGLANSEGFYKFVSATIPFFAKVYKEIRSYEETLTEGFEDVHYCSRLGISYHILLALSAIKKSDSTEEIDEKIKLAAFFADYFYVLKRVNNSNANWNSNKPVLFNTVLAVRNQDPKSMAMTLNYTIERIQRDLSISIVGILNFGMNGHNSPQISYLLSRFNVHLDELMGKKNNSFDIYMSRGNGKGQYQIEHILPSNYPRDHFDNDEDFDRYRNRIGDLLLLGSRKNQSNNDAKPEDKMSNYSTDDTVLAKTLCAVSYQHNPNLERIKSRFDLEPMDDGQPFEKERIEKRSETYRKIAEDIWNTSRFQNIAGSWSDQEYEDYVKEIEADSEEAKERRKIQGSEVDKGRFHEWANEKSRDNRELVSLAESVYQILDELYDGCHFYETKWYIGVRGPANNHFLDIHLNSKRVYLNLKTVRIDGESVSYNEKDIITNVVNGDKGVEIKYLHGPRAKWPLHFEATIRSEEDIEKLKPHIQESFEKTLRS